MSSVLVIGCDTRLGQQIGNALSAADFSTECATGYVDALSLLRARPFGLVITSLQSSVEEDLALLEEMRLVRHGLRFVVLANHSTPEEVIAAFRAKVFACFTPPFDFERDRQHCL
jgi:DNA-binding NtrC family response regulator